MFYGGLIVIAKQRFVLDTTAFTDNKLRDDYGDGELHKTVDVLLDLIARSRIKLNMSCHMPPITYKEFSDYITRYECPQETMIKAETWIVKKSPNRYDTKIPSEIFYEYVQDMRERMNKGMRISESAVWEAAVESMVMMSRGGKTQIEMEVIEKPLKISGNVTGQHFVKEPWTVPPDLMCSFGQGIGSRSCGSR